MDEIRFVALMTTATDKYTKMVDAAYRLKNRSNTDEGFDNLINLIHSTFQDQAYLIYQYTLLEAEKEEKKPKKKELKIPCFMVK